MASVSKKPKVEEEERRGQEEEDQEEEEEEEEGELPSEDDARSSEDLDEKMKGRRLAATATHTRTHTCTHVQGLTVPPSVVL